MCVVCRALRPKAALFRFVREGPGPKLALDREARPRAGRGLYLCKTLECLERLQKERRLRKLFLDRFSGEDLAWMRCCLEQPAGIKDVVG
jgi:hypothetical protein